MEKEEQVYQASKLKKACNMFHINISASNRLQRLFFIIINSCIFILPIKVGEQILPSNNQIIMALQPFSNNSHKQRSVTLANKNRGAHHSDN